MNDLAFTPNSQLPTPNVLDEALTALGGHAPALTTGNIDHGPMAVDALDALGLADRIEAFAAQHLSDAGVVAAPSPIAPIDPRHWRAALGQPQRFTDWTELLHAELAASNWRALAQRWVARLTPGAAAAALHGLIRTAHAVRALERSDTRARQKELVQALASWAALYGEPPWPSVDGHGDLPPDTAFLALTPAPEDQRASQGSIVAGLGHAMNAPALTTQTERVDMSGDPRKLVEVMLRTLAAAFLTEARSGYTAIVWCHAITATLSVRRMMGVLTEAEARTLLTRVFEVACAMKAAFTGLHADHDPGTDRPDTPAELARRAADTGDDHAIKLTDALLEAHASDPDPVFLETADRAIRMLNER